MTDEEMEAIKARCEPLINGVGATVDVELHSRDDRAPLEEMETFFLHAPADVWALVAEVERLREIETAVREFRLAEKSEPSADDPRHVHWKEWVDRSAAALDAALLP